MRSPYRIGVIHTTTRATPPSLRTSAWPKACRFLDTMLEISTTLRFYLLNPLHMTRFADLLQQGAILKRVFQPYEAHLQYLLQWMCDFNLYGCADIEVDAAAV